MLRKVSSLAFVLCLSTSVHGFGQGSAGGTGEPSLHIDVPTKLERANVAIDFGHAVFAGDMPFALGDIRLLAGDIHDWDAKGQLVVIFHGDAAYLILNDESYNKNRHVETGNPFKEILNVLLKQGIQLELCGATAKGNGWGQCKPHPRCKGQRQRDGSIDSVGAGWLHADLPVTAGSTITKRQKEACHEIVAICSVALCSCYAVHGGG